MSYEKREKKRSVRKRYRIILISFVLLYLIFRSTPIIFSNKLKTTLTQVDTLKDEFQCDGVVIKNEQLFKFDGQGIIEKSIGEGSRVPVGINIANLNFLKDTSGLKFQLEEIENTIKVLSDNDSLEKIFEKDKEIILKNKEESINDIQNNINRGNFQNITFPNNNLSYYDNKESEIFKNRSLLGESIKSLEERKDFLKSQIDENNISYKTEISGVISYEIDGYENMFLPREFENYTYDNLNFPKIMELKEEFNGFKIIDNFTWYLALKIDDAKDIDSFEENDLMKINFVGQDNNINGKIIKINKTDKNAVVILMFRNYFQDYYKIRFSKINILKSSKSGYKIPKNTIIEKEGQKGVYVKDFNGIVKFKPILIIGEDNEYIFVDMGKSGYIDIPSEKESVITIGRYDEIFLKPNRIQEGQIVN